MEKNFDFKKAEKTINEKWLFGNMFRAEVNKEKKPFTIIMPPPNITSRLHIGHAFDLTIQDAIIRFKRMQGFEALLLPGADHAAIATEVKVVEHLRKQGIEKKDLTKQEFMVHVNKWYEIYTAEIVGQMKRLGLSADWSRFRFTMDDVTTKAVKEAFERLHKKGLVYKGERMINYCPRCRTALSDAEVEHVSKQQTLYNIKFPFGPKELIVATVRPEVIFGDAAVAVNPKDKRYLKHIGDEVFIPLTGKKIPIIADDSVDMKFGTGVLQITPAHSHVDYEIAIKHSMPIPRLWQEDGVFRAQGIGYNSHIFNSLEGLSIEEARKLTIEELKKQDLIAGEKKHTSNVGVCYRCACTVEPTLSKQWFIKMEQLAKPALEALGNGLTILPRKFEKVYAHWLGNIKDWCISRQLTSGHKIPIDGETDVLDTWFSSALWPFSTLGWPDNTQDFDYFYPTQTMVTAYDIIFFWVIRMVFSGMEYTGKLPFETVILHGLVRDMHGKKMSKSTGNGIDPLDIIEEFGADALRFSIIAGTKLDRDPRYGKDKATLARNFINKIWNAVKYYHVTMPSEQEHGLAEANLSLADKWILTKLDAVIKSTTKKYEKYDFGVAAHDLQRFFWHDFCDWYVEATKVSADKKVTREVYRHVLLAFLKLINPIMPFITEEIYCEILREGEGLLRTSFPVPDKKLVFYKDKKSFDKIIGLVGEIRAVKNVHPETKGVVVHGLLQELGPLVEKLSGLKIEMGRGQEAFSVEPIIDKASLRAKADARIAVLKKEIERSKALLSNPGFVARAPKELQEKEREKLSENLKELEGLSHGTRT